MIYLSKITLPSEKPNSWPYNVPSINSMESMEFLSPVTFIAGDNGSGKSTLMEALAIKLKMPAIGRTDAARDESINELRPLARMIRHHCRRRRSLGPGGGGVSANGFTDSDLNSRQWTKSNANGLRHPLSRAHLAAFLPLD